MRAVIFPEECPYTHKRMAMPKKQKRVWRQFWDRLEALMRPMRNFLDDNTRLIEMQNIVQTNIKPVRQKKKKRIKKHTEAWVDNWDGG